MPAPYSLDLRHKILATYEGKEGSMSQIAMRFKVSSRFVQTLVSRYRAEGTLRPKPHQSGNPSPIQEEHKAFILSQYQKSPDLRQEELRERLQRQFGIFPSASAISRGLKRLGISRKKKTFYDPEKDQERFKLRVQAYWIQVYEFAGKEFLFLDESGAALNLALLYGFAEKGKRLYAPRPVARGARVSTIGVLSQRGLETAMCFQGTLNGQVFAYFAQQFLADVLDSNKVLVLDNASPHKNANAVSLIESTGAKILYLPPYSPEMNPIEYGWAKVKCFLRNVAPRTIDHLYDAWAEALNLLDSSLANNCFAHCGFS